MSFLTDALSRYGEVQDVRFRHWLHMSEVADGARVVSMVCNRAIPHNLVIADNIVRFLILARPKNVISVKRLRILLGTVPRGENI